MPPPPAEGLGITSPEENILRCFSIEKPKTPVAPIKVANSFLNIKLN
ncbi:hypothetical protein [Mycoplasma suis]|nr:hypothetical protein [Mycoplasma suis]